MGSGWKGNSSSSHGSKDYQGYNNQGYWPNSTTIDTPCNHDKKLFKPCFKINGLNIFGAAKLDIPDTTKDSPKRLIVNCTGYTSNSSSASFVKSVPTGLEVLKSSKYQLKIKHDIGDELLFDWDDGKAPLLIPGFWPDLLSQIATAKYEDVVFCCIGGHGRTGTALASILLASGESTDPDDAIAEVRANHCKRAIETFDQIDYLEIVAAVLCKWKAAATDGHCTSKPAK